MKHVYDKEYVNEQGDKIVLQITSDKKKYIDYVKLKNYFIILNLF